MCNPVAIGIATFALGAGQSIANFAGAKRQAARQNQYRAENTEAARAALGDRYVSLANRFLQEREAAVQAKTEVGITTARQTGQVRAQAASAGVEGHSVDALIADYYGQQGRSNQAIDRNLQITEGYIRGEQQAAYHQAVSRINSVPEGVEPSVGALLLNLGSAALGGFSSYNDLKI